MNRRGWTPKRSATACWRWLADSTPRWGARRSRTWPCRGGPCTFSRCAPGPGTSDFGRLFDRADPGSIVGRRGESVVAPQALFFLNDPFVS